MASGEEEAREGTRAEYRTTGRKASLVWASLFVAWGIVSLVRIRHGHFSGFVDVMGIGMGALVPFLLNTSFGKIVLDDTGIHTWRPLWRRTIPWQNVRNITMEEKSSRGNGAHRVRVYRRKGLAVWLPAPFVQLRATDKDMDHFAAQVAEITAWWQAYERPDRSC